MNNWIIQTECHICGCDVNRYKQMEQIVSKEQARVKHWHDEIYKLEQQLKELQDERTKSTQPTLSNRTEGTEAPAQAELCQ